ncbi:unnamed protein product [Penicillium olsonii]|nr:unnamed protein product [Penicillium olsonii]
MMVPRVILPKHPMAATILAQSASNSAAICARRQMQAIGIGHSSRRLMSSSPKHQTKEYFPPPKLPGIKQVNTVWSHPVYSDAQTRDIKVAHREAKDWADWIALGTVRFFR